MLDLIVATTNKGKVKEFKELLAGSRINLLSLDEHKAIKEPIEDGKTFAENAELKAKYYALETKCFALADDSGLEVDFLDNAPGIYSARYAGENASDNDNIAKLLEALKNVEKEERIARFVCEMAISDKYGKIIYAARGVCNGKISDKPNGQNGFGYDPIFIPSGFDKTFGELSSEIKQQISHRSKTVKQIIGFLSEFSPS